MAGETSPEVSVIVPAYKVTRYIAEALDSVLAQTLANVEIVVVNDGCPDTAALDRVLEKYLPRIRYIKQPNTGLAGACNTAIGAARAPLISHLDPDDWFEPDCLEKQVRFMREHPELEACYCNSYCFAETPKAAQMWGQLAGKLHMDVHPSTGPVSFTGIMEWRTGPRNPASMIRREAIVRIGLYDPQFRAEEDLDVWLRLLKAKPPGLIGYITEPLVHYRLREDSLTMDAKHLQILVNVMEKAGRTLDLTAEERAALEKRVTFHRYELTLEQGKRAVLDGRWKDARKDLEYCQSYRPNRKIQAILMMLRIFPPAARAAMRAWNKRLENRDGG